MEYWFTQILWIWIYFLKAKNLINFANFQIRYVVYIC